MNNTTYPYLFIICDNLAGGSTLLLDNLLADLRHDRRFKEVAIFTAGAVEVDPSFFSVVQLNSVVMKFLPRFLVRIILCRRLKEKTCVLNLTNFPVGRLGVARESLEICLFHNAYMFSIPPSNFGKLSPAYYIRAYLLRHILLRALILFAGISRTRFVVQSDFMKRLADKYVASKCKVIKPHFPPVSNRNKYHHHNHNLLEHPELDQYWLYPASGDPHKNHKLLISLVAHAKARGLNVRVIVTITPRSSEERALLKNIERQNLWTHIKNVGWVTQATKEILLSKCKGIVFFSNFESLGIPVLEAIFFRKPIVAIDSAVTRELLGETFPLFDLPREEDKLLEALSEDNCSAFVPRELRLMPIINSYLFDLI